MVGSRAPRSAPKRALEILMARLHEPWSVARLARVLGLSSRTLYRAVRRELGASPMGLLREVRLTRARVTLEAPSHGTTVTSIAFDCGFTHLGRFSSEYKRRFGELPSETLRRAALGGRRACAAEAWRARMAGSG